MNQNLTNIKDDNIFITELLKTKNAFRDKKNSEGLVGSESTIFRYLERIYKISTKEENLVGKKEDYISIQRILSDDLSLFKNKEVSELSYYFSYLFKI